MTMLNNIVYNYNNAGSKTLLNTVFINFEQVASFLSCIVTESYR